MCKITYDFFQTKNRHNGGFIIVFYTYLLTQFAKDCAIIDVSDCVKLATGTV